MNQLYEEYKDCSQDTLDKCFLNACSRGDLDAVKYLLTSPELGLHASLHAENNDYQNGIIPAYANGHMEVAQYLLTFSEIAQSTDINKYKNQALVIALINGRLKPVKSIILSPGFKEHVDINVVYASSNMILQRLIVTGNLDTLEFLIFNMNIKSNDELNSFMEKTTPFFLKEYNAEAKRLFKLKEIQDFNDKLENDLSSDKLSMNKKMKL